MDLDKIINEVILEMLESEDEKLISIMRNKANVFGENISEEQFLSKTISLLKEQLGQDDDSQVGLSNEQEKMLYLSGVLTEAANDTEKIELTLYITNNAKLYKQKIVPVIKNLKKKVSDGTYKTAGAIKLWTYVADEGAKMYAKEFASMKDWNVIFNVAIRRAVATDLESYYYEEVSE